MASAKVIALVREQLPRDVPVFAKLSPDVTDITAIAAACVKAGADGLTMINTLLGMVIDTDLMRPHLGGVTGGLSGPGIRPVAVRAIWQVRQAMAEGRIPVVPIIGVGGVRTGRDALELVAAGASAVQVGTATFNDPTAPVRVLRELTEILVAKGHERFSDVVGAAHGSSAPGDGATTARRAEPTTVSGFGARLQAAHAPSRPALRRARPAPRARRAVGPDLRRRGHRALRA